MDFIIANVAVTYVWLSISDICLFPPFLPRFIEGCAQYKIK